MINVWIVDKQGFRVDSDVKNEADITEFDIIVNPHIINEDGSMYIPFTKEKWNGTEWIEGATEEEIKECQAQQNRPNLPSSDERITNIEAYLVEQVEKQYMEVINV